MPDARPASVLFAELDPSFVQMAAVLSPTYADSMGPSAGGRKYWPRIDLPGAATNDDFVAALRADYVGEGFDPEIRFADDERDLIAASHEADVLVTERTRIDAEVLDQLGPRLRFIQKFGAWVPSIDVAAAAERGILVSTWRRQANRRVAEHVVLLTLALLRQLPAAHRAIRAFDPTQGADDRPPGGYTNNWVGMEGLDSLGDKSLGLIGLGEVGSEVAALARNFGTRMYYTQRRRNERAEAVLGVEYLGLDELLASSDIVSMHLPLNDDTRGFLSERELSLMRPSSYLVNVSRGALVDEDAVVNTLSSRSIAGAAFDTFWTEPLPPDHPLVGMDNVVLTPHVASGAVDSDLFRSEFRGPLVNVSRVISGKLPYGVVNVAPWPGTDQAV